MFVVLIASGYKVLLVLKKYLIMREKILDICKKKAFFIDKESLELFSREKVENFEIFISRIEKLVTSRTIKKEVFSIFSKEIKEIYGDFFEEKKVMNTEKVSVRSFLNNFRSRYDQIKKILEEKGFDNLTSVRKINDGNSTIIVSVFKKSISRNKNIFFEVEDMSGRAVVFVNQFNINVFKKATDLLEDDIVALNVTCVKGRVFVNNIFYPDSFLKEKKFSKEDNYIAFCSDLHIGSKNFLENRFLEFVKWINGEISGEEDSGLKVKYLFFIGDNIDGTGHYSGQEKILKEKTPNEQYEKLAELLKLIREDVKIFICPGQHDAVWVGEVQNAIGKRWAKKLCEMPNVELVTNPAMVEVDGFKILMYHGASLNKFIDGISNIRVNYGHKFPTKVAIEILKRRHIVPMCGVMDYVPVEEDKLVIKDVPDIFAIGDQHRADVSLYNNILIIASSCWQSTTAFEEKIGNIPDPCKVPILNLKTREIKIMDFSEEKNENSN